MYFDGLHVSHTTSGVYGSLQHDSAARKHCVTSPPDAGCYDVLSLARILKIQTNKGDEGDEGENHIAYNIA